MRTIGALGVDGCAMLVTMAAAGIAAARVATVSAQSVAPVLRSPPVAPVRPVADDHFGTRIVDNYRYFENLKYPEVQEWMKAQADYARATLDALPGRVGAARSVAVKLPSADSTLVILLGTGNPVPDPEAAGPATAVVVGPRVFLFDAGAGVMRRVRAAKLPTSGPTALFITHLHSDHTLGYPDVIFTTWVMGRTRPLDVFGPHGLQSMTDHIIAAWKEDIDIRSHGLEHRASNGYAVRVHEIAPGVVYDSGGVKITAIPVLHGSWKEAYGYRIDTPDRSIVLSGDTRPSQAIEEAARGVDVLIHEAYPESANLTPRDSAFASYRRSFHTSAVELGRLAAIAKPKMVVLYHHVLPPDGGAALIAAVRGAGYQGRVIFGKDLDRF